MLSRRSGRIQWPRRAYNAASLYCDLLIQWPRRAFNAASLNSQIDCAVMLVMFSGRAGPLMLRDLTQQIGAVGMVCSVAAQDL